MTDHAQPLETSPACERCGNPEAQELGGSWLCRDCIELAGCGCGAHAPDPAE